MDNKEKKDKPCPQLYEGKSYLHPLSREKLYPMFLGNVEVYNYSYRGKVDSIISYLSSKSDEDYFETNIRAKCTRGDLLVGEGIPFIDKMYASNSIILNADHDHKSERVKYHVHRDKLISGDSKGKELTDYKILLDYDDLSVAPLMSKEKRMIILLEPEPRESILRKYLNTFIALLSGDYIIPHPYEAKNAIIVNQPIYGSVELHTTDGRFYLQYNRNVGGALVGEVIRTQIMPHFESPEEGEIAGCFAASDGSLTPVYFSYYDPAGTGKQITREEYIKIRSTAVYEAVSVLPKELTGLLNF